MLLIYQPGPVATFSPLNITSFGNFFRSHNYGGYSNTLNTFMDHHFEGEAPAQRHIKHYPAVVYTGVYYNATFEGTVEDGGTVYLQGTRGRDAGIILTIPFESAMARAVSVGITVQPELDILFGEGEVPTLNHEHASYIWYEIEYMIAVVLRTEDFVSITLNTARIETTYRIYRFVGDLSQNPFGEVYEDAVAALLLVYPYLVRVPAIEVEVPAVEVLPPDLPFEIGGGF